MERISTGDPVLDELLQGGFPTESTILIVGRPGSGKTVMAHQTMFLNATSDSKVIYLTTLAEPLVKVLKFQQEFTFFDPEKFQHSVIYQDLSDPLRKEGPKRILEIISELLKLHEPKLLVIDSIKTVADMISTNNQFREFLQDLSLMIATWGCTMLLLSENSEAEIESRPESAIADGIIYLAGAEEKKQQKRFMRILKMRGTGYTGGEIFFTITNKGFNVFPRLKPSQTLQNYQQSLERLSTGISNLDFLMNGGIPSNTTTLVSGAPGSGKTILGLHFAYAGLQSGEAVIYVSFEENPQQILSGAFSLGIDLQPYIAKDQFRLIYVSPMELDVDEHIAQIQKIAQTIGAKRLVFDSISSFEIGMSDKVKYTDYIWSLTDFFKYQGITVLLTHELRDSVSLSELTKHGVSFVADNIVLLRLYEDGIKLKRNLCIIKMRSSKHSNLIQEFQINEHGFDFQNA